MSTHTEKLSPTIVKFSMEFSKLNILFNEKETNYNSLKVMKPLRALKSSASMSISSKY